MTDEKRKQNFLLNVYMQHKIAYCIKNYLTIF